MVVHLEVLARRLRRAFGRSEWLAKLLSLPVSRGAATRPGLVMIQIDGLGLKHLEKGIAEGRMPFLARLRRNEGYKLYRHYAGIPSNTPAVQGALFYGVKSCVPAFSYRDKKSGKTHMLFNPASAIAVQKCLEEEGPGLLEGGSAYGNIFTGGAQEAHFCAAGMGWGSMLRAVNPLGIPLTILLNLHVVVRAAFFLLVEFVVALGDCFRGILSGKNIKKELTFIPLRMAVCVFLRDASTEGAKIDVARGLPVVHVNLAGFDEQAHHRGPGSRFAMWSLKGIDHSIKKIYKAARDSEHRDYDVFVYSDHGQEDVQPYKKEFGRTIQEAVAEAFKDRIEAGDWRLEFMRKPMEGRAYLLRNKERGIRALRPEPPAENAEKENRVLVTAMGPIGHVYPPAPLSAEEKAKLAQALVTTANVPFAMIPEGPGRAVAWNADGMHLLPEEGHRVIAKEHPFFEAVIRDLVELAHHQDAGEILLFGWRDGGKKPMTFMGELGSHAGPGPVETSAFALLPFDALPKAMGENIETADLRKAALLALGRLGESPAERVRPAEPPSTIRVMTYNVHGCLGRDGKISPSRIARIIGRRDPDVVCLQELDPYEGVQQAETVAKKLGMNVRHYSPLKNGRRALAVLSPYPLETVKQGPLPRLAETRLLEPRGVLWVEVDVHGQKIQVLNTHLSLSPHEACRQSEALIGKDWLDGLQAGGKVVVCGDFNAEPLSAVCCRLGDKLKNVQFEFFGRHPLKTLPSYLPVRALDHIFTGPDLRTRHVESPRTDLERVASDHLPVLADIEIL